MYIRKIYFKILKNIIFKIWLMTKLKKIKTQKNYKNHDTINFKVTKWYIWYTNSNSETKVQQL